jgi:chemotaxis protein MotB
MLYSISQVNENKYKDLTEAMNKVFQEPRRSLQPIQVGEPALAIDLAINDTDDVSLDASTDDLLDKSSKGTATANLPQLSDVLSGQFASFIDDKTIQVNNNELWLEISLSNSILFPLGSVVTNESAQQVLLDIADILKPYDNPVQVEGYTDNLTVNSTQFPSNWELSSARAAAIIKKLIEGGVVPSRLSAVGYGEHHPTATNDTPEGREKNRRVVLMIAREKRDRPKVKASDAASKSQPAESLRVNPQTNSEPAMSSADLEPTTPASEASTAYPPLDENNTIINNTIINNNAIVPVKTEKGGLLFKKDSN